MELFAKSKRGDVQPTLAKHTRDVMDAFKAFFGKPGQPTRLAEQWTRFFKLDDVDAFSRNGLAAAAVHDIGKANDGFQDEVTGHRGKQLIRHEHLSGLLLGVPEVYDWLESAGDLDVDVILSAVVSHHLKVSHKTLAQPQSDTARVMHIYWDEPKVQQLLKNVGERLDLLKNVPTEVEGFWGFKPRMGVFDLTEHVRVVRDRLAFLDDDLDEDEPRRRLLWAVRAALIAADSAGSGLVREGEPIDKWIAEAFDESQLCDGERVWRHVIRPRVAELKAKGRWKENKGREGWSTFQDEAAKLPDRSVLLAPCGSGKTLAAWRWIAARLSEQPVARVIFLYPTRGTATEGFRDYVSFAPEADVALMHGTARYDLEEMFTNPGDDHDPRRGKSFEAHERLFALKNWPKRIFSATVDQFLAFTQYSYGAMCQLPLLVDSVIVIDEVHSFDRGMFSALMDFLTTFDVPVLCMTATLPPKRLEMLQRKCGLTVYNEKPDDLRKSAEYARYKVTATTKEEAVKQIKAALASGKRVLWVVNQVKRAQGEAKLFAADSKADKLHAADGFAVFCYHSRYKLDDRVRWHRAVVDGFKPEGISNSKGVLAVTTQVCEMSLDLNADLLVTEEAPIPSLIQRMGRCCREPLPKNGRFGEVLIYRPEDGKPYKPGELAGIKEFVEELSAKEFVNQLDLEDLLERAPQVPEAPKDCRFLISGPYAMAGEENFRDIKELTQQAVLSTEVDKYLDLCKDSKQRWKADGLILPVPKVSKRFAKESDQRLPRYLRVVPEQHYHPALGFLDGVME